MILFDKNDPGQTQLSRDHAYYYQMQSQINICKQASYGDFIFDPNPIFTLKGYCPTKFSGMGLVEKATTNVCYMNWWENFTAELLARF